MGSAFAGNLVSVVTKAWRYIAACCRVERNQLDMTDDDHLSMTTVAALKATASSLDLVWLHHGIITKRRIKRCPRRALLLLLLPVPAGTALPPTLSVYINSDS